jgi:hypothetical protein
VQTTTTAHGSPTDCRRLESEAEFRGKEWAIIDRALVPSPDLIAEAAAECRQQRVELESAGKLPDVEELLDQDALLPAALIRRALDDVEMLEKSRSSPVPPDLEALLERAMNAVHALYWLFSEKPVGANRISFEEACLLAGCREPDVMRRHIRDFVRLSPVSLELIRQACS